MQEKKEKDKNNEVKKKNHCELCKVLNMIAEGRKHPSVTVWNGLTLKLDSILAKDPKAISSISGCERHSRPLDFVVDIQSATGFVAEVKEMVERAENSARNKLVKDAGDLVLAFSLLRGVS